MRNIIIHSILALIFFSCGQNMDEAQNEIILNANPREETEISTIAAQIDYIQLETTQESLIGDMYKVQIQDSSIYILDLANASLFVFDISGKFVRRIGYKGNGPGEYAGISDFAVCDSIILLLDQYQMKLMLFETSGNFIAEKLMGDGTPEKLAFLNGQPICQYNYPDFVHNDGYRISIFDRDLHMVEKRLKTQLDMAIARQVYGGHTRSFLANVDDTLTFWEAREDVVYKIINKDEIVKKYQLRYQNQAKFEDGIMGIKEGSSEMSVMLETKNYMFFIGIYKGEFCRLIYNKQTNEITSVKEKLKNSMGPDFFPNNITGDGRIYDYFSVYAYKTELEENNISSKNLDSKLQSLLRTCNFDDNPCIMLVTLK